MIDLPIIVTLWKVFLSSMQVISILCFRIYHTYHKSRMSIIVIDATRREVFKDENVVDQNDSKNFILIKMYIYNENSIVKPTKLRLIYWWLCWWLNSVVWRVWWIQQVEDPLQHLPPLQGAVGEEHGRRKIQDPTLLSTIWSPYKQSEECRRAEILLLWGTCRTFLGTTDVLGHGYVLQPAHHPHSPINLPKVDII